MLKLSITVSKPPSLKVNFSKFSSVIFVGILVKQTAKFTSIQFK